MVAGQRTLVIEGGGDHNQALQIQARAAFTTLQEGAKVSKKARVVVAGGRGAAYERFCTALKEHGAGNVWLLVDAEEAVRTTTRWAHVKQRVGDGWAPPAGATEANLHFMNQVMETWLLADSNALAVTFKKGFQKAAIPKWPDLEAVPKLTVYAVLEKATGGAYSKGEHSFKALARVDVATLEKGCPAAKALFDELRR